MKRSINLECPICGHHFKGDYEDICPVCDWMVCGWENEAPDDFYSSENHTTIKQAKDNYAKGLNIWGKPIKSDAPERK
ncbi:MAG: hypothetical protein IKC32_06510 [Clostridia bacterium]|nr:hypothetical protein [Clostridia bacterium]